jgi:hypothetical protein
MRWMPYALVFWIARRKLERWGPENGITYTMPFRGEFIGFIIRDGEK